MHRRWSWPVVAVATIAAIACTKKAPPAPTSVEEGEGAASPPPVTKEAVEDEMGKAGDGPDCATFVTEVRRACVDHYAKGLEVDCHAFVTAANAAVKQRGGQLFQDPSHKDPGVATKAGDKMCAMSGKRLREAVAKAGTTPPAPSCVEMGRKLDSHCFEHIGTDAYDTRCSAPLIVTKKVDSDPVCRTQMLAARSLLN